MAISMKQNNKRSLFQKLSRVNKKTVALIAVALVIIPSVVVLGYTYGPMASIEVEDSTLSGGATLVSDTNASGGESVKFSDTSGGVTFVMPDSTNTGPRYPIERTLTPTEALTELRTESYLSKVRITGRLQLSGDDGRNWVIEDSVIQSNSLYGIQAYNSLSPFTGTHEERPMFRYIEIVGRAALGTGTCEAGYYGSNTVLQNARIYGCKDGAKLSDNTSLISSWLYDNDRPAGAHCDAIQITRGTGILVEGSRLDAYVGYVSDNSTGDPVGSTCSGALQTGEATGDISAIFENNWFAGGHYTIRGWASSDEQVGTMSYMFRNNKWRAYGESVALGRTDLDPNRWGPTYGTLGDFDSSNVWEDTGSPV